MSTEPNPYQSPENDGIPTERTVHGRRQRSTFWIVSTHIVTTSIVMPLLTSVLAGAVVAIWQLSGEPAFLTGLAFLAVGYINGTYYSLSYLNKTTAMQNPQRCAMASIITFVLLALLSLIAIAVTVGTTHPRCTVLMAVFYVAICWAFARITQKGFAKMAEQGTAS